MPIQIRRSAALNALNMTPLIDVVFLLLIFFLVTAQFAQESRELPVRLPDAVAARPLTETPEALIINIDRQGAYFVDLQPVSEQRLLEILRQAKTNNPASQSVQILADRSVPFDAVVGAMDACNQAGIDEYTVRAEPKDSP